MHTPQIFLQANFLRDTHADTLCVLYVKMSYVLTCPARSRIGISSGAILQLSLVTKVTAAPERLQS